MPFKWLTATYANMQYKIYIFVLEKSLNSINSMQLAHYGSFWLSLAHSGSLLLYLALSGSLPVSL